MHIYKVKYRDKDGAEHFDSVEGCSPGNAFAKCQKANPGAVMLEVIRSQVDTKGRVVAQTRYEALPVQRDPVKEPKPFRAPKRDEKDGTMAFYDDVIGLKA